MKTFLIGKTVTADTLADSKLENLTIVVKRDGDIVQTDFHCYPERSVKVSFSPQNGRVAIEFQLNYGEFLAIGDSKK